MSVSERKIKSLIGEGFEEIGVILQKDGKRATVDKFGRVQWWEIGGSGEMVSSPAYGGTPPPETHSQECPGCERRRGGDFVAK